MFQVYLVENDTPLNHLLSLYLQKEGWSITSFLNGEKACKYIDKCPHIWITDSWLPDVDGYQLLAEVKEKYPKIPVILISERNSITDRVIGLEMGCDDYLPKPFLPRELVLRAKKILERTYDAAITSERMTIFDIPPYKIDEISRMVYIDTKAIDFTSKEFDLLLLFAKNPLRTFSRDQILKYVWNDDHFGSDRSVDDLVRRLRKKAGLLRIESVYGYGYRLLGNTLKLRKIK
jgi:Response regulators consisting of a CheY-like receiver domain and a winged-helix DNA-binding domain